MFREDCTPDELIDVINRNRVYLPCVYVYNKVDQVSIEEVDRLAHLPHSIVVRYIFIFSYFSLFKKDVQNNHLCHRTQYLLSLLLVYYYFLNLIFIYFFPPWCVNFITVFSLYAILKFKEYNQPLLFEHGIQGLILG